MDFKKSGFKVVIFDFDGVIVESNGIKDIAFKQIFSRYPEYYLQMMEYHHSHVSESRVKKFDYLIQLIHHSPNEQLKNSMMKDFSSITLGLMKKVSFVPGAIELLENLSQVPVYLASVTPIHDLEIIIKHLELGKYFKGIYGCPPWNKPDAIFDILEKENIQNKDAVLIGDSSGDQKAAMITGINFIARNSGLAFDLPSPINIFNDLNEVTAFII